MKSAMIMQPRQSLLLALSALFAVPATQHASPLVSIGDNADIFFNGSSSIRWTSNLFRDEDDEVDDFVFILSPGFELNLGRGASNADLSIVTRYDILMYDDRDELDTELFHIKAMGAYETSRMDTTASISFDERQTTTGDANIDGDLIESEVLAGRISSEYRFSPKFSFGGGIRYSETDYVGEYDDFFADREEITFPIDLYYELTPKVDLSVGYAYSQTEVGETIRPTGLLTSRSVSEYDTESHFFNVGARGNLLPKLDGFFKIGYRTRELDDSTVQNFLGGLPIGPAVETDRDDRGTLGIDADLTWAATPKLTVGTQLGRDFGVGGEGEDTTNTSARVNATYSINANYAASAFGSYILREYEESGDDDNQYNIGLRLNYIPNQYWRIGVGYTYSENDSDRDFRSYEDHTFDLTASLRY